MIYLDNSATTRTFDTAANAARKYMTEVYFNPSSAYSPAVSAEKSVNEARRRLCGALGAASGNVIYTSGATESNNMAISGCLSKKRGKGRIIVSSVEHPSVYETAQALSAKGYEVVTVGVDETGKVDLGAFGGCLTADTDFVSIMQVNNETGAVNDLPAIRSMIKKLAPNAVLHVDGVQGFLKVPVNMGQCDMYSISGHKFHAPKGVGALYVGNGVRFGGGQTGGGQESGLRSGTLNVPGIMGMDAAITTYLANEQAYRKQMVLCKQRLYDNMMKQGDVMLNGPSVDAGAPHILNLSFLGVRGEVMLHALEAKGVLVSTGSACSSHKKGKNRILGSMGITGERLEGAIRFSFSPMNTIAEIDTASEIIAETAAFLRKYKRR